MTREDKDAIIRRMEAMYGEAEGNETKEALFYAIEALKEQRPHGEWINKDYGIGKCWATCSECGESTNGEAQDNGFGYDYSFPKFCPNCGADMREGEAE